jgi:hypothetical protein
MYISDPLLLDFLPVGVFVPLFSNSINMLRSPGTPVYYSRLYA